MYFKAVFFVIKSWLDFWYTTVAKKFEDYAN